MTISQNKYDAIEAIIVADNLRIETISIFKELDLMLVILNTKSILRQKISTYTLLKNASSEALNTFEIIGTGTGIHWPLLDEDLSLKGFLKDELRKVVHSEPSVVAA